MLYEVITIAHALDLRDPRADRTAEDNEVERCRNYRRDDALQERPAGTRHLEQSYNFV